jgi:hypothetical protein
VEDQVLLQYGVNIEKQQQKKMTIKKIKHAPVVLPYILRGDFAPRGEVGAPPRGEDAEEAGGELRM